MFGLTGVFLNELLGLSHGGVAKAGFVVFVDEPLLLFDVVGACVFVIHPGGDNFGLRKDQGRGAGGGVDIGDLGGSEIGGYEGIPLYEPRPFEVGVFAFKDIGHHDSRANEFGHFLKLFDGGAGGSDDGGGGVEKFFFEEMKTRNDGGDGEDA